MLKRTLLCVGLVVICLSLLFSNARADVHYKVKPGDNLSKIAKKHGIKPQDIRDANQMQGSALSHNQVLVIPQKKSGHKKARTEQARKKSDPAKKPGTETEIYRVKKGDTIQSVAAMADCSVKTIRKMNRLKSNSLKVGRKLVIPKPKVATDPEDSEFEEDGSDETIEVAADEPNQNPNPTIGKWSSPDERNLFIRVVKTFLGVPYRYGGSSLRGLDCSAFVRKVYEVVDISLPRTAREQSQAGRWIKKDELQDGDLVFFRTRRVSDHVGIYIGNNQFVHLSSKNREAKINHLDEPYFYKRFIRGVRVKEMKPEIGSPSRAALQS